METKPLTCRQQQLLEFIQGFIRERGYAPTYEEMRVVMGYANRSTVAYQVEALQLKGYIERRENRVRAIWVVRRDESRQ